MKASQTVYFLYYTYVCIILLQKSQKLWTYCYYTIFCIILFQNSKILTALYYYTSVCFITKIKEVYGLIQLGNCQWHNVQITT